MTNLVTHHTARVVGDKELVELLSGLKADPGAHVLHMQQVGEQYDLPQWVVVWKHVPTAAELLTEYASSH